MRDKKRERERMIDRLMFYFIDNFFDCIKSDYFGFFLIIFILVVCISF